MHESKPANCSFNQQKSGELMMLSQIHSKRGKALIFFLLLGLSLTACNNNEHGKQPALISGQAEVPIAAMENEARGKTGEAVYQQVCMACHASGMNGAPEFGDRAAWADLIEEGYGILVYESIKGEGMMPPRGGVASLTDIEVARAVAYMANAAGADFVAPATEEETAHLLARASDEIEAHEARH